MSLRILLLLLISGAPSLLKAQAPERKIVIEHGRFYYTTIDEQFQVATLHSGLASQALSTAKRLALPAGRNYNDPIIPFSWDVSGASLYAVNFLMHPLNDRNEAIKKLELSRLKEWDEKTTAADLVIASTETEMLAYNDPYRFITNRSDTLSNFFFDGIVLPDGSYWMAISNNGELSIWKYDGIGWKHGMVLPFKAEGYFDLFSHKQDLYLIRQDGSIKKVNGDMTLQDSDIKPAGPLSKGLLVINKDDHTIKFILSDQLDRNKPLKEVIQKKALHIL